jgi:hypothetical protein
LRGAARRSNPVWYSGDERGIAPRNEARDKLARKQLI